VADNRSHAPRLNEVLVVWLLFGITAVFVFITYWRLPLFYWALFRPRARPGEAAGLPLEVH
jgi:hypothetical protein